MEIPSEALTAKQLADALGISVQAVLRKQLPYIESNGVGRGGKTRIYKFSSMPEDIKLAIAAHWRRQDQSQNLPAPSRAILPALPAENDLLPQDMQDDALAKADLLRLYVGALSKAEWGKKDQTRTDFMAAYNSGIAWPTLYQKLGALHWKTLEGWRQKVKSAGGDTLALADTRGKWRKGRTIVTPVQFAILLKIMLNPNKPKPAAAIRMARKVMRGMEIDDTASDATYMRCVEKWIETNYHIWTFTREGAKAWNDKCAYYIERDYSLINVGDVIVADGHVLNFEILNPWTGKPKRMTWIVWKDMKSNYPLGWEIMPTENTQAISSALRRAIIALGKMPQVAYLDNGRAFKSKFFQGVKDFDQAGFSGLYDRLGMKTIFAWPYHGQSKTVERFFGSFAELERWSPTYTGTSIGNKPPRMNRGERLHVKAWDKVMGGRVLTMEQAHVAIAHWLDEYVNRPQSGHLNGSTPLEWYMAERGTGVDKTALRYLMMSMEVRTINRNGIHLWGQNYYHPALYGRKHTAVIRYDYQEKDALYVFEQDGEFICEATPTDKVHPAATALGTDEDRAKLTEHIRFKKEQEKEAAFVTRDLLENEILPEHRRQMAEIGINPDYTPVKALPAPVEKKITAEEEAKIMREVAAYQSESDPVKPDQDDFVPYVEDDSEHEIKALERMSDMDKMYQLIEFEVRGLLIPKKWKAFMTYYEQMPEYKRYEDHFEEHRMQMAVVYQTENVTCRP